VSGASDTPPAPVEAAPCAGIMVAAVLPSSFAVLHAACTTAFLTAIA
jgi:hypothetical protein